MAALLICVRIVFFSVLRMLKLNTVPCRVIRNQLGFLTTCSSTKCNGRQSRSFSGFLGKGMYLKESSSPPISTESLHTFESHVREPLEGEPEIRTLSNEIVSIYEKISRCKKEISENELKLENVESELLVRSSASNFDPGSEEKRDRLYEALRYYRKNVTQLMAIHLSLLDDERKKEAELVNLKTALKSKKKITWREDSPKAGPLAIEKRLFFVNRDKAAIQLLEIHNRTQVRAQEKDGGDWEVALCANDNGGGKSIFASNYISLISKLADPIARGLRVFSYLENAITIHIRLRDHSDLGWDLSTQLVTLIKQDVTRKAAHNFDFNSFPETLLPFMQELVKRSDRSIFLVIDGVGDPFRRRNDRSDEVQAEQLAEFKEFTKVPIRKLLGIPGLFLLLCGRAPFLNWVGTRPNDRTLVESASPVKANRIVLNMIGTDGIIQILQNTHLYNSRDETLSKFLNLDGPAKGLVEVYAEKLYQTSAGHPRTMAEILFQRFEQIERRNVPFGMRPELVSNHEESLSRSAIEILEDAALKFSKGTQRLLKECGRDRSDLDLSEVIDGLPLVHLLPPLRIGVNELSDGSIQLRVPDHVRLRLEALVSPLHEYLSVVNSLSTLPIDFPFAFKILIAKVFNKFFQVSKAPYEAHNSFFGSSFFGNWTDFACDTHTKNFPKVTEFSCKEDNELNVKPEGAKVFVANAFKDVRPKTLWFFSEPKSRSPDLVHLSVTPDVRRVLCIAVKNYSTSELLKGDIEDEIKKAELMIPDGEVYESVLVVACTKYDKRLEKRFNGSGFQVYASEKIQKLNEVVLLNLTSPERRRMFCGIENANEIAGLEHLLKKTQAD